MPSDYPETIDKFQVLQFLAEGGMGRLYLGRDPDIGRLVAIKLLREGFDKEEFRQRFSREAKSASALRHANIVTIFQTGTYQGQPFIVMEYIQGETLAEVIGRKAPLTLERKLQLMDELSAGLQYAHRKGVIHRDIKPANIMLDEDGVLRILDFGIARFGGADLTQSGAIMGTLNYMAPEQLAGRPVDVKADMFSAGAVFYELLSYRRAFPGSFPAVLQEIAFNPPDPLQRLKPELDVDLIAIVNRCLSKSPADRYPDFGAVRQALVTVWRRIAAASGESTLLAPALRPIGDSGALLRVRAEEIRRHIDSARQALDDANYSRAMEACQGVLVLDPECTEALDLENRARTALQQQQLISRWLADARAALEEGDATAASVLTDRALSLSSDSPEALAVRRAIDEARRQWAETEAARALVDEARQRFGAGDHASALAMLERFQPAALVAETLAQLKAELQEIQRRQREAERAQREAEQRRREEAERRRIEDERRRAEAAAEEARKRQAFETATRVNPTPVVEPVTAAKVVTEELQPRPQAAKLPIVARPVVGWRAAAVAAVFVMAGAAAIWRLPVESDPPLPAPSTAETPGNADPVAARVAALRSAAGEAWQRGDRESALTNVAAALALQPDDAETRALVEDFVRQARERAAGAAADARARQAQRTSMYVAALERETEGVRLERLGRSADAARAFGDAADLFGRAPAESLTSAAPTPPVRSPSPPPPVPRGETPSPVADRIATLIKEAEALRQRREYDAAIARYGEVLQLAPQDARARTGLGETQAAKQRAEEALRKLGGSSREAEATAQSFVDDALKAMKAGDDAAAQKALEQALRVDPRNESAQKLLKVLTGR